MKLHKNLCAAVVEALDRVFIQGLHAPQVIESLLLSNKKWGARDRAFIAAHSYAIVRYCRLYTHAVRIAAITTSSDAWKVLGAYFVGQGVELPRWDEFTSLNVENIQLKLAEGHSIRKIRESIPDWLDTLGSKELGDDWDRELATLNLPARLSIRTNRLKTTKRQMLEFLSDEGVTYQEDDTLDDAILLDTKKNLTGTYAYRAGWFEIQDLSSQQVAPMLELENGMSVIDACAGAGGKTLHIAALLDNTGLVTALDIIPDKLKELERRAERNGAVNIRAMLYTDELLERLTQSADRLLLDVPCTGLGVLRRNPDAKWKLSPQQHQDLIETQQDILQRYHVMLKKGGILVYATCSFLPSENENQISAFVKSHPEYSVLDEKKISPFVSGSDGFYICKLRKG